MIRRISGRVLLSGNGYIKMSSVAGHFGVEKVGLRSIGFFSTGVNFTGFFIKFNENASNYRSYVMSV